MRIDGEEKAGTKGVRGSNEVSKIKTFANAFNAYRKISTHRLPMDTFAVKINIETFAFNFFGDT
jgi:hypothetical protein